METTLKREDHCRHPSTDTNAIGVMPWSQSDVTFFLNCIKKRKDRLITNYERCNVLQEVAHDMCKAGYLLDHSLLKTKWNSILATYRNCKKRRGNKKWKYVDIMDDIFHENHKYKFGMTGKTKPNIPLWTSCIKSLNADADHVDDTCAENDPVLFPECKPKFSQRQTSNGNASSGYLDPIAGITVKEEVFAETCNIHGNSCSGMHDCRQTAPVYNIELHEHSLNSKESSDNRSLQFEKLPLLNTSNFISQFAKTERNSMNFDSIVNGKMITVENESNIESIELFCSADPDFEEVDSYDVECSVEKLSNDVLVGSDSGEQFCYVQKDADVAASKKTSSKKTNSRHKSLWSSEMIKEMLHILKKRQTLMKNNRTRRKVLQDTTAEMIKCGYKVNYNEVKIKWNILLGQYRKHRSRSLSDPPGMKKWMYYLDIADIVDKHPSKQDEFDIDEDCQHNSFSESEAQDEAIPIRHISEKKESSDINPVKKIAFPESALITENNACVKSSKFLMKMAQNQTVLIEQNQEIIRLLTCLLKK